MIKTQLWREVLSLIYVAVACAATVLAGGATSSSAQILKQQGPIPLTGCGSVGCVVFNAECALKTSGICNYCPFGYFTCLIT